MIQTVKLSPVGFKGEVGNTTKAEVQTQPIKPEETADSFLSEENKKENENVIEKKSIKEKAINLYGSFLGLLKKTAKTKETTKGTVKGIFQGAMIAGTVAFVGKNIQEGKGQIGGTIVAMGKNAAKAVSTVVTKTIPYVWNASPKKILKSVVNLPKGFYKYCASGVEKGAKGSKTVGIIATAAGIGALGFNAIKGLAKGNKQGAEIDHYTGNGHVPIK